MKRVFAHFMRLVKKVGFILFFAFAISPIAGLGLLILFMAISMLLFKDPVDMESEVEELLNHFTEEELEIIFAEKVDEKVSDDDYLALVAKYQSYVCENKKIDEITTWTGSAVNKEAFIYLYELNDKKIESFDIDKQKEAIRKSISKDHVQTYRIINSGRDLIFRYTYRYSRKTMDVVFSNEELKNC
jgi:hypothetical protein